MSHHLNKATIYFLFGSAVFIGATALTVLIDKPTAYGAGCGEDCRNESYPVYGVPYQDRVCRTDTVPITHYYNTTRQVKQYYSYQVPGPCRTETGWTCERRNRWGQCTKKNYYRRQVCEPARTVSGWYWRDEPITASYITWEPKQVCELKTLYRTETYNSLVCTPKVCPPPPPPTPPTPTCQNDPGCTSATKGGWQCIAGADNQYKVCQLKDGCYKWTGTLTCGANTTCFNPTGSVVPGECKTKPGSGIPGVLVSDKCFTLTVGNGPAPIARTGNFALTVAENAKFSLRWDLNDYPGCAMISNPLINCEKWGTQLSGPGGNWQGSANKVAGNIGPFSFSGLSNQKPHNFAIACNNALASNLVIVTYERGNTPPPPPSCTPCSNPGSASKSCINSNQWQECVTQNGKNCLATFSCSQFSGTTCSNPGGYCVGKPINPGPDEGCKSNANCPSGTTCDIPSGRCVIADTHAACQNGSCVSVSGPGANQCAGNLDCPGGFVPPPPQQPPPPEPPCVGAICDQPPSETPPPPLTCRPGIDSQCTPPGGCIPGTSGCPTICTIGVDCPGGCTVGINCPGAVLPPGGGGVGGPFPGSTQCSDGIDNDLDTKIDGADTGCFDSEGKYDWRRNEFNFKIKEIIPDFFNLNWFKINVANFFKAEALAK